MAGIEIQFNYFLGLSFQTLVLGIKAIYFSHIDEVNLFSLLTKHFALNKIWFNSVLSLCFKQLSTTFIHYFMELLVNSCAKEVVANYEFKFLFLKCC